MFFMLNIKLKVVQGEFEAPEQKRLGSLEALISLRNEAGASFDDLYHRQSLYYQPVCLKDAYLFFLEYEFNRLMSLMDGALDLIEQALTADEQAWSAVFCLQKRFIETYAEKLKVVLSSSTYDYASECLKYFKYHEFARHEITKGGFVDLKEVEARCGSFGDRVDEFRRYFNVYETLPETADIRRYINEYYQCEASFGSDYSECSRLYDFITNKMNLLWRQVDDALVACKQGYDDFLSEAMKKGDKENSVVKVNAVKDRAERSQSQGVASSTFSDQCVTSSSISAGCSFWGGQPETVKFVQLTCHHDPVVDASYIEEDYLR